MQFDTDLVMLRQQSVPFYLRWQFWWTAVPILLTLVLAATAITLRVRSPNAVRLKVFVFTGGDFLEAAGSCLLQLHQFAARCCGIRADQILGTCILLRLLCPGTKHSLTVLPVGSCGCQRSGHGSLEQS